MKRQPDKRFDAVFDLFERHKTFFSAPLVQLFTIGKRGEPDAHGTALTVSHNGQIYLVSASHCFDPMRAGKPMLAFDGAGERQIVGTLKGLRSSDADVPQSVVDLAVFRLDESFVPTARPVPLQYLVPSTPFEGEAFVLVAGYPASKTDSDPQKKSVMAQLYANFGPSLLSEEYNRYRLDPTHQIAMHFAQTKVIGRDGHFRKAPKQNGMSGSPMWTIDRIEGNTVIFQVVGILTDHKSGAVLAGTTIEAAIAGILEFANEV
jgi:hypothetical protein